MAGRQNQSVRVTFLCTQNQAVVPGIEDWRGDFQIDPKYWPARHTAGYGLIGQGGTVKMNAARSDVLGFDHETRSDLFLDAQVPLLQVRIWIVFCWSLSQDDVSRRVTERNGCRNRSRRIKVQEQLEPSEGRIETHDAEAAA